MHILDMQTIGQVLPHCNDDRNPATRDESRLKIRQWLLEISIGELTPAPSVLSTLEAAQAQYE